MSKIQIVDENFEKGISFRRLILNNYIRPQSVAPAPPPPPIVIRGLIQSVNTGNKTLQLNCFFMMPLPLTNITILNKNTGVSKGNFTITSMGIPSDVINTYQRNVSVDIQQSIDTVVVGDIFEFESVFQQSIWISPPPEPLPSVYGTATYNYNSFLLTANPVRTLIGIPAVKLFYTVEGSVVYENNVYNITNAAQTSISDATCNIPSLGTNITGSIFFWGEAQGLTID